MKKNNAEITTRAHRLPGVLLERILAESDKSGSSVNGEINSLILDGLRFREAKVTLNLKEE